MQEEHFPLARNYHVASLIEEVYMSIDLIVEWKNAIRAKQTFRVQILFIFDCHKTLKLNLKFFTEKRLQALHTMLFFADKAAFYKLNSCLCLLTCHTWQLLYISMFITVLQIFFWHRFCEFCGMYVQGAGGYSGTSAMTGSCKSGQIVGLNPQNIAWRNVPIVWCETWRWAEKPRLHLFLTLLKIKILTNIARKRHYKFSLNNNSPSNWK